VSERCENKQCQADMGFPCAREVLAKTRNCPACGHTQRVEKSILYVVETLEEQVEWLDERFKAIEEQLGITARIKPQPVPKVPVIDLLGVPAPAFVPSGLPHPAIDLFGVANPAQCHKDDVSRAVPQELKDYLETAPKLGTLKDLI